MSNKKLRINDPNFPFSFSTDQISDGKIQFFVPFDIESCEIVHFTILYGFYCSLCTNPKNKKHTICNLSSNIYANNSKYRKKKFDLSERVQKHICYVQKSNKHIR